VRKVKRFATISWVGPTVVSLVAISAGALQTPPAKSAVGVHMTEVKGIEIVARHTRGTFVGYSTGALPGEWTAVVEHTPLSPNATITGGTLRLVTGREGATRTLTARFTGGTITNTRPGADCTDQTFRVVGKLTPFTGERSGTFSVTLTHYRHAFLGFCVSYFATTTGTLQTA
jgi:hypothetical protein